MAIVFLILKNPFVGFASPFFFWSPSGENSPQKKTLVSIAKGKRKNKV
jgi:hypothetical protein